MKIKTMLMAFFLFFAFTPFYSVSAQDTEKKPVAVLPEQTYNFAPVVEGVAVTHDFILQNKGNADLVIENVKSG